MFRADLPHKPFLRLYVLYYLPNCMNHTSSSAGAGLALVLLCARASKVNANSMDQYLSEIFRSFITRHQYLSEIV